MNEKLSSINAEGFFEEGGMEMLGSMTDLLKSQQQGAIELTRLVLEYCKEEEITKNYVFEIFEEAMDLLKTQFTEGYD